MPYCVLPKTIGELVTRRRVVINEANVSEFVNASGDSVNSSGGSMSKASSSDTTSQVSSSASTSNSSKTATSLGSGDYKNTSDHKSGKKHSRLSDFISSSSRTAKRSEKDKSSSSSSGPGSMAAGTGSSNTTGATMYISQDPILAQLPASNPFSDNRFPVINLFYLLRRL